MNHWYKWLGKPSIKSKYVQGCMTFYTKMFLDFGWVIIIECNVWGKTSIAI